MQNLHNVKMSSHLTTQYNNNSRTEPITKQVDKMSNSLLVIVINFAQ